MAASVDFGADRSHAADVSLDLLFRGLFALGESLKELAIAR